MKFLEVKAKTVDEAVEKALSELNTTKENVEYKDSVRAEIQAEDEESQQNDKYYAILDELMGLYPVEEYPKDVEAYELNAYMAQAQQGADQYGMELEDYVQTYYGLEEIKAPKTGKIVYVAVGQNDKVEKNQIVAFVE